MPSCKENWLDECSIETSSKLCFLRKKRTFHQNKSQPCFSTKQSKTFMQKETHLFAQYISFILFRDVSLAFFVLQCLLWRFQSRIYEATTEIGIKPANPPASTHFTGKTLHLLLFLSHAMLGFAKAHSALYFVGGACCNGYWYIPTNWERLPIICIDLFTMHLRMLCAKGCTPFIKPQKNICFILIR